jgi:hypothetical protein
MKRTLKWLLRPLWRLTLPVRARAAARLDEIVHNAICRVVAAHDPTPAITQDVARRFDAVSAQFVAIAQQFAAIARQFDEVTRQSDEVARQFDEVSLGLDAVVAEQFRLQSQIEALEGRLRGALATASPAADGNGRDDECWR